MIRAKRERDQQVGQWEVDEGLEDWHPGDDSNIPIEPHLTNTSPKASTLPVEPNISPINLPPITPQAPSSSKSPNRYKGLNLSQDHFGSR